MIAQVKGILKANLSKHDLTFSAARMSLDMVFSYILIFVAMATAAWCLFAASEDADGGDDVDCTCLDAHCLFYLNINGDCHLDFCCGENERKKFTNYNNY